MEEKNSFYKWTAVAFIVIVIVIAGFKYFSSKKTKIEDKKIEVSLLVVGSTTPLYGGESILDYQFSLPNGLKSIIEDNGRTILVNDANNEIQKSFIYLSNQEYKGYTEEQYFDDIILPTLSVIPLIKNTIMVNNIPWYHVETNTLMWDIASFKNEKWLTIIKSKKGNEDVVSEIRRSFLGK